MAAVPLSARADVIWTGGGFDPTLVFDDANWGGAVVDESVPVLDDMFVDGQTINASDFTSFGAIALGNGFELTFTDSTFVTNGTGGFHGVDDDSGTASTTGVRSRFTLINSNVNLQFASLGSTILVDGTSRLTFRGGGDPINSQLEMTEVYLSQGGQLELASLAEFDEQGDEIFASNSTGQIVSYTSDNSILTFDGNVGTAVFAVPEPGGVLLLTGLLVGGLIRRQR